MNADHCLIKLEETKSEMFGEEALKLLDRFITCKEHQEGSHTGKRKRSG